MLDIYSVILFDNVLKCDYIGKDLVANVWWCEKLEDNNQLIKVST